MSGERGIADDEVAFHTTQTAFLSSSIRSPCDFSHDARGFLWSLVVDHLRLELAFSTPFSQNYRLTDFVSFVNPTQLMVIPPEDIHAMPTCPRQ
jgi:hypothetical protein